MKLTILRSVIAIVTDKSQFCEKDLGFRERQNENKRFFCHLLFLTVLRPDLAKSEQNKPISFYSNRKSILNI